MRMEANVGHGLRGGAVQPQGKEGKAGAKGGVLRPKTNAVGGAREGLLDGADSKEGSRGGETAVVRLHRSMSRPERSCC